MKLKSLIFTIAILVSTISYAQTEKGKFALSGVSSLSYNNISDEYVSVTTVNFNLGVGYFVAKNLLIGASGSILHQSYSSYTENSISIIPTITYYLGKNQLKPYIEGGVGYVRFTGQDGVAFGGGGGLAYMIGNNISFDITLNYLKFSVENGNADSFTTGLGFTFFL